MRILHINCNYIGSALHQKMIESLDALGYESTVFVPTYDKDLSVIRPNSNVVISECFNKKDRLVFDYKQHKILKNIIDNINIQNYNLVHAYTLFTDGNCARKLSKKYNIPYVVAVRNTDVNAFFKMMPHLRARGIKIMREAKAVFFLSKSYQKQVFEKYVPAKFKGELEKKTYIIPNGIDDFWFNNDLVRREEIKRSDRVNLLYVGRIDKNKNIPTTQAAAKLLRSRGYNISLTVVGKIEDKEEFNKIEHDPNTIYISAKPKEELIKIYQGNDIFVMPSHTETFGLVYAEAMSQGLPVIYTKGQGFDGQFIEGKVGFHVCSYNPEDIEKKILKIIKNYKKLSESCVSNAVLFKWSRIVELYDACYKSIDVDL